MLHLTTHTDEQTIWAELAGELATLDIKPVHAAYAMDRYLQDVQSASGPELEAYARGFARAHHEPALAEAMCRSLARL